ncbi:MAG: DUF5050 domain-containing protein [Butyrivibrio sp.]|nr:DUF5050 domain-containing protein [Butyrivibrio sp.]
MVMNKRRMPAMLVLGTLLAVLLSSCGGREADRNSISCSYKELGNPYTVSDMGMLYAADDNTIRFTDINSNENVYVCSRLNCRHGIGSDGEQCQAVSGMLLPSLLMDSGHIYIIGTSVSEGKGSCAVIYRENLDGSEREKIAVVDDVDFVNCALLSGEEILFSYNRTIDYSDSLNPSELEHPGAGCVRYNLKTGKTQRYECGSDDVYFINVGKIYKDDKYLYIYYSYTNDKDDGDSSQEREWKSAVNRYGLDSDESEDKEQPDILCDTIAGIAFGEGYAAYVSDGLYITDFEDTVRVADGTDIFNPVINDGKLYYEKAYNDYEEGVWYCYDIASQADEKIAEEKHYYNFTVSGKYVWFIGFDEPKEWGVIYKLKIKDFIDGNFENKEEVNYSV